MNFTENFDQFSGRVTPTDLALYAGIGIVLWILFKDKLSPVQEMLLGLIKGLKNSLTPVSSPKNTVNVPTSNIVFPTSTPVAPQTPIVQPQDEIFFQLVASWKKTRDLAEKLECQQALEAADQMFPFLSPNICNQKNNGE